MIPDVLTFRMRELSVSAMKMLPWASTATVRGLVSRAEVAGPPSPLKPSLELPAMVLIAGGGGRVVVVVLVVGGLVVGGVVVGGVVESTLRTQVSLVGPFPPKSTTCRRA